MPAKKGTKQASIKSVINGGSVYVHSNYFVKGVEATKDKITLRIGLSYYDGSPDKMLGLIKAKVVDTEVQIDETQVGTKSLPTIKGARRILLDALAYLNKTTAPTSITVDDDDESEDVRAYEPTSQGKKVIVIPMTKVSSLVNKTINGFYVKEVSIYYQDGKWNMVLFGRDDSCNNAKDVFGCDYEIVEE